MLLLLDFNSQSHTKEFNGTITFDLVTLKGQYQDHSGFEDLYLVNEPR